jgi:hypothetical protein
MILNQIANDEIAILKAKSMILNQIANDEIHHFLLFEVFVITGN